MFAEKNSDRFMLVYNTTYHVEDGQEKYFLIWMREFYLPEVEKGGMLRCRVSCVF